MDNAIPHHLPFVQAHPSPAKRSTDFENTVASLSLCVDVVLILVLSLLLVCGAGWAMSTYSRRKAARIQEQKKLSHEMTPIARNRGTAPDQDDGVANVAATVPREMV
ncbi:hypothetical protein AK830_g8257 [Neonectria ditissima]|uniref:Uncharacterized protein n=1 Tax=Neonectria ditissima TaxID=78410 RepID=A0A0P7BD28_9HYPO|nr:hypothetical protein AK830_g8257 [Neonectria ditissima]